ncbi:hypothetical protein KFL_005360040 [Klebsormidium nitens]|uniref:Uncharacterized protein n=1 Tax=Klebsormidium nitens TaxID=105231 RepID=A0A1Y1IF95_KLENI|nr:hypothetical protein KFL_005360040 [Klebsormidium nitens]|eukprot:GAQ89560.1 hypothetical protein KFL_005360040 [Klebsormidium nitens]
MKAWQLLPEGLEESLSTKRLAGFSKLNITPAVLVILTLLNLWIAAKPTQVQQLLVVPNCCTAHLQSHSAHGTAGAARLSPPAQAETLLRNLQLPNDTWRSFPPTVRHDPILGYDYGLAHKVGWLENKTRIWECMDKVGPRRQITFVGDSVTRDAYARMVEALGGPTSSWVGQSTRNMAIHWWLAQGDFELDSGLAPIPGTPPPANVTLSFRFACNAFPHMTKILSDPAVSNSDVLVLNSGLWEMGTGSGTGTLNGSWMRDYMYRLSQLVLHLKENYKGRVIWRTMGAIDWYKAKERDRFLPFKFRAMNLFAEGLFRGAGYEVVDFWSAMAIDTTGLTTPDGVHGGEAILADLVFNKVCLDEPLFSVDTAAEIVKAVDSGSMPPPKLQGPDPPFVPFP